MTTPINEFHSPRHGGYAQRRPAVPLRHDPTIHRQAEDLINKPSRTFMALSRYSPAVLLSKDEFEIRDFLTENDRHLDMPTLSMLHKKHLTVQRALEKELRREISSKEWLLKSEQGRSSYRYFHVELSNLKAVLSTVEKMIEQSEKGVAKASVAPEISAEMEKLQDLSSIRDTGDPFAQRAAQRTRLFDIQKFLDRHSETELPEVHRGQINAAVQQLIERNAVFDSARERALTRHEEALKATSAPIPDDASLKELLQARERLEERRKAIASTLSDHRDYLTPAETRRLEDAVSNASNELQLVENGVRPKKLDAIFEQTPYRERGHARNTFHEGTLPSRGANGSVASYRVRIDAMTKGQYQKPLGTKLDSVVDADISGERVKCAIFKPDAAANLTPAEQRRATARAELLSTDEVDRLYDAVGQPGS